MKTVAYLCYCDARDQFWQLRRAMKLARRNHSSAPLSLDLRLLPLGVTTPSLNHLLFLRTSWYTGWPQHLRTTTHNSEGTRLLPGYPGFSE